jgi:hypothetical protein
MAGYAASDEIEKSLEGATGRVRGVIMPVSYVSGTATVVRERNLGQTLEDFYKIHNLDENRRKYLEDLRAQVRISTGGPLNNLLYVMGWLD